MDIIALGWAEHNEYVATIGPGIGRPVRPVLCPDCDATRIWFDGWRWVFVVVLSSGELCRFDDGLPLQRVCCAACGRSWTLQPAFLYPQRSLEPDVAEAAAFSYLSEPSGTYEETGKAHGCSTSTAWRWVGWIGGLLSPPALVAEAERLEGAGQAAALIPREVPQDHVKARSPERKKTLLSAFQTLAALAVWSRAQRVPPLDPSPLRFWLVDRFQAFREIHRLTAPNLSPPLEGRPTGPPATRG